MLEADNVRGIPEERQEEKGVLMDLPTTPSLETVVDQMEEDSSREAPLNHTILEEGGLLKDLLI